MFKYLLKLFYFNINTTKLLHPYHPAAVATPHVLKAAAAATAAAAAVAVLVAPGEAAAAATIFRTAAAATQ